LHEMRRPSHGRSSPVRTYRRVRCDFADAEVWGGSSRQLRRNRAAYARRFAQAEGFPRRVRRIGPADGGVAAAAIGSLAGAMRSVRNIARADAGPAFLSPR